MRRRALSFSVLDGVLHAAMVGAGESYLGALAVELGHGDSALALLATVPMFAGAVSQFFSGRLASWLGSRKRLVVLGAALQALSHLGLIWISLRGEPLFAFFLATKTLFWVSGMVIAPPWNAWMADLTTGIDRARYFAIRSGLIQTALVVAYLVAGYGLHAARDGGQVLTTYAVLFGAALVVRGLSAGVLAAQGDVSTDVGHERLPLLESLKVSEWRVAVYIAAVMFGTHVSAPFFTPYMLRTLELDYGMYALLTATSIVTKAMTFPLLHRFVNRYGLRSVIFVSGAMVAAVPFLWAALRDVPGLFFVEGFSGIAWAGFEYATFQILLVSAPERHRLAFFSVSGALIGFAQLAGSVGGSAFLATPGNDYLDVFVVSGIFRSVSLVLLLSVPAVLLRGRWPQLFMRIVSVRTGGGALRRPIAAVVEVERQSLTPGAPPGTGPKASLGGDASMNRQ